MFTEFPFNQCLMTTRFKFNEAVRFIDENGTDNYKFIPKHSEVQITPEKGYSGAKDVDQALEQVFASTIIDFLDMKYYKGLLTSRAILKKDPLLYPKTLKLMKKRLLKEISQDKGMSDLFYSLVKYSEYLDVVAKNKASSNSLTACIVDSFTPCKKEPISENGSSVKDMLEELRKEKGSLLEVISCLFVVCVCDDGTYYGKSTYYSEFIKDISRSELNISILKNGRKETGGGIRYFDYEQRIPELIKKLDFISEGMPSFNTEVTYVKKRLNPILQELKSNPHLITKYKYTAYLSDAYFWIERIQRMKKQILGSKLVDVYEKTFVRLNKKYITNKQEMIEQFRSIRNRLQTIFDHRMKLDNKWTPGSNFHFSLRVIDQLQIFLNFFKELDQLGISKLKENETSSLLQCSREGDDSMTAFIKSTGQKISELRNTAKRIDLCVKEFRPKIKMEDIPSEQRKDLIESLEIPRVAEEITPLITKLEIFLPIHNHSTLHGELEKFNTFLHRYATHAQKILSFETQIDQTEHDQILSEKQDCLEEIERVKKVLDQESKTLIANLESFWCKNDNIIDESYLAEYKNRIDHFLDIQKSLSVFEENLLTTYLEKHQEILAQQESDREIKFKLIGIIRRMINHLTSIGHMESYQQVEEQMGCLLSNHDCFTKAAEELKARHALLFPASEDSSPLCEIGNAFSRLNEANMQFHKNLSLIPETRRIETKEEVDTFFCEYKAFVEESKEKVKSFLTISAFHSSNNDQVSFLSLLDDMKNFLLGEVVKWEKKFCDLEYKIDNSWDIEVKEPSFQLDSPPDHWSHKENIKTPYQLFKKALEKAKEVHLTVRDRAEIQMSELWLTALLDLLMHAHVEAERVCQSTLHYLVWGDVKAGNGKLRNKQVILSSGATQTLYHPDSINDNTQAFDFYVLFLAVQKLKRKGLAEKLALSILARKPIEDYTVKQVKGGLDSLGAFLEKKYPFHLSAEADQLEFCTPVPPSSLQFPPIPDDLSAINNTYDYLLMNFKETISLAVEESKLDIDLSVDPCFIPWICFHTLIPVIRRSAHQSIENGESKVWLTPKLCLQFGDVVDSKLVRRKVSLEERIINKYPLHKMNDMTSKNLSDKPVITQELVQLCKKADSLIGINPDSEIFLFMKIEEVFLDKENPKELEEGIKKLSIDSALLERIQDYLKRHVPEGTSVDDDNRVALKQIVFDHFRKKMEGILGDATNAFFDLATFIEKEYFMKMAFEVFPTQDEREDIVRRRKISPVSNFSQNNKMVMGSYLEKEYIRYQSFGGTCQCLSSAIAGQIYSDQELQMNNGKDSVDKLRSVIHDHLVEKIAQLRNGQGDKKDEIAKLEKQKSEIFTRWFEGDDLSIISEIYQRPIHIFDYSCKKFYVVQDHVVPTMVLPGEDHTLPGPPICLLMLSTSWSSGHFNGLWQKSQGEFPKALKKIG